MMVPKITIKREREYGPCIMGMAGVGVYCDECPLESASSVKLYSKT